MTLRLRTFGAVHLEREQVPLGGAHGQRRRLTMLVSLAAANGAAITRDKLIALLWPERDVAGARHALSQLLYALRHDLGADCIALQADSVRLNTAHVTSDVQDFETALRADRCEDAVALYRGPFLDGFYVNDAPEFERWVEDERTRLARACAQALERLAGAAEREGDPHAALERWRQRAMMDPTDDRVALQLMRMLAAVGDRQGALRAARVHASLLREELEVEPDAAIVRFVEGLRHGGSSVATVDAPTPSAAAGSMDVPTPLADAAVAARAVEQSPRREKTRARLPIALLGVAAAITVFAAIANRTGSTDARDGAAAATPASAMVIVGQLEGPDPVLSLAVREALRAALVNTNGVVLAGDAGLRQLRTLMRLPVDAPLRPPLLLAMAARRGAHFTVSGSVLPVGAGTQIVLDVHETHSERPIRTLIERPADDTSILAAVERIGLDIGNTVTRAPRDSNVRALPAVTTASLPALKSYAQARQLAASGERERAIAPAERAVTHDSTFVLAHLFLGDVLWFLDQQTHSDEHMTRAFDLAKNSTLPRREQLVIRARYEQLVRDRPDSALAYWDLLRDASPGDVLAYEGRTWALRALGRHAEAAASADSAMRLDPSALVPNTNNAMYSWLSLGDTASALAIANRVAALKKNPDARLEAEFYAAYFRGDFATALSIADRSSGGSSRTARRHMALLARGDTIGARAALEFLRSENRAQFVPRALLTQGWTELAVSGDRRAAAAYAREALAWLRSRDLSPPAVARIAERIADLAARGGDEATVRGAIELVTARDRSRRLRSYVMARRTIDAALAFVNGEFALAARLAESARHGVYFSRSLVTIAQLEADARRMAGQAVAADSLDRLIASHQVVDGDFETWAMLRASVALRDRH